MHTPQADMSVQRRIPRLIACDLDGTLLCGNGVYSDSISPRTVKAVAAFQQRGGHFVLATGNGWAVTRRWRSEAQLSCEFSVCSDGACVFGAHGELVYGRRARVANVLNAPLQPLLAALEEDSGSDGDDSAAQFGTEWHIYTDPPAAYFSSEWARRRVFQDLSGMGSDWRVLDADFTGRGWRCHVGDAAGAAAAAVAGTGASKDGGEDEKDLSCSCVYFFVSGRTEGGDGSGARLGPESEWRTAAEALHGRLRRALHSLAEAGGDGSCAEGSWEVAHAGNFLQYACQARAPLRGAAPVAAPPSGVDVHPVEGKHVGLSWVAAQLGVAQADVMALGDGANDISMLRWAGWGATPANFASEAVRAAADEVLPRTNNEDAVAVLLEEIVNEMDREVTVAAAAAAAAATTD